MLMMVAFWVLVVAGIVWVVLALGGSPVFPRGARGGTLGILEERFARGEIDADEFRAARAATLGAAK